ncbi:hypothetical protein HYD27_26050 [Paenibacillus sp. S150]|nr:hypothetical protein [Paenibacillus sp. S150]
MKKRLGEYEVTFSTWLSAWLQQPALHLKCKQLQCPVKDGVAVSACLHTKVGSSKELQLPVLYDIDCGHVPPQLTLINGAYAEVELKSGEGSGTVKQMFKP